MGPPQGPCRAPAWRHNPACPYPGLPAARVGPSLACPPFTWSRGNICGPPRTPFDRYASRAALTLLGFTLLALLVVVGAHLTSRGSITATAAPLPARVLDNRITAENTLPGTDDWASTGNADSTHFAAFAGATSVNAGSPVSIYVTSTTGTSLSARLYRLGYYQGHGARLVTTYSGIATPQQPACTRDSTTGLVVCPWAPTFTINTDPTWISGIYLLRLDSNDGYRWFVYFTLRNDGYNAEIVVQEASKTNQAYNNYGGESLYTSTNNEGRARAYKVSFDRPYASGAGTVSHS